MPPRQSDRRVLALMVGALILSAVCGAIATAIGARSWSEDFEPIEGEPGEPEHVEPLTVKGECHA